MVSTQSSRVNSLKMQFSILLAFVVIAAATQAQSTNQFYYSDSTASHNNELGGVGIQNSSSSSRSHPGGLNNNVPLSAPSNNDNYRPTHYYYTTGVSNNHNNGNSGAVWNRDSYADAASEFGYGADSSQSYTQYQPANSYGTPSFFPNSDNGVEDGDGKHIFHFASMDLFFSGIVSCYNPPLISPIL